MLHMRGAGPTKKKLPPLEAEAQEYGCRQVLTASSRRVNRAGVQHGRTCVHSREQRASAVQQDGQTDLSAATSTPPKPKYTNANMPVDPEGRTYHLNTRLSVVPVECSCGPT
eukprot:1159527-Pelagomonas_calceolata.AAC.6